MKGYGRYNDVVHQLGYNSPASEYLLDFKQHMLDRLSVARTVDSNNLIRDDDKKVANYKLAHDEYDNEEEDDEEEEKESTPRYSKVGVRVPFVDYNYISKPIDF